jgi:hypothetical protein
MAVSVPIKAVFEAASALRGRRRPVMVQRNRSEDEGYIDEDHRCSVFKRCVPLGFRSLRLLGECDNYLRRLSIADWMDRTSIRIRFWRSVL